MEHYSVFEDWEIVFEESEFSNEGDSLTLMLRTKEPVSIYLGFPNLKIREEFMSFEKIEDVQNF